MGNYWSFLQGPLPVANYTRIIIPGRFWTRPPSLVPRPSSAREERGRVWNITPGGSVPKERCAQVIMTRNLAFVVSRAYKECKLRSILLKCARARAVHTARLGTFCRPFEYSGLTPCIVANQHLSQNFCLRDTSAQGYVPDPPSLFSRTGGSGDETNAHLRPKALVWPLRPRPLTIR